MVNRSANLPLIVSNYKIRRIKPSLVAIEMFPQLLFVIINYCKSYSYAVTLTQTH